MRKAEKRRLGEIKAAQDDAERKASGLAAQKADREARLRREATPKVPNWQTKRAERNDFFSRGINPSTGLLFTDAEMAEMEKKANTPARRHLFERIQAGRAGALNEQPPLGGIDDYLGDVTVGDFRSMMDVFYAKSEERMRRETMSNPDRAREFAKAMVIGGFFEQAAESLEKMAQASEKVQETLKNYVPKEIDRSRGDHIETISEEGCSMAGNDFQDRLNRVLPLFQVAEGETEAPIRKLLNERYDMSTDPSFAGWRSAIDKRIDSTVDINDWME